jgi:outer membrane protein assembly factor BamB
MKKTMRTLIVWSCLAAPVWAENWPAWRGPDGQGHSGEKNLPTSWDKTANVRWKTALPDKGNSTPIVWGNRVFLTQASEKVHWPPVPNNGGLASARRRSVMCFDRNTGKLLWQQDTIYEDQESTHPTNPFCSASPVTDGERVIASLGSAGMVCYDFHGKELWRKDVGKLEHIWGNASSPIIYRDLAILWCGPGERQFLLAVNKSNGATVWEHQEAGGAYGKDNNWLGSWSTPLVARIGDHEELILGVPGKVKAFDPKTGTELWSCAGLGKLVYTSAVCSADGIILAMGGFHGPALAVRGGGKGDVTNTHRLWVQEKNNPQRIGSPVVAGENAFILNDNGAVQCLELKTGKDLWNQKRLTTHSTWGSMVAGDGKLYITDREGETHILKASADYAVLCRNSVGEPVYASIAIADGELFIRTYENLWCIGGKKTYGK